MGTTPLSQIPAGTTVDHPTYGRVTVSRQVNRGDLTNVAGFPPATYINHPDRGEIAVNARTFVEVVDA